MKKKTIRQITKNSTQGTPLKTKDLATRTSQHTGVITGAPEL